jgi:hypothetical protein
MILPAGLEIALSLGYIGSGLHKSRFSIYGRFL